VFHSGAGDYKGDCASFLTWVTKKFGKPSTMVDMSRPGKQESWVEWTADWSFGQTRVQATCGGLQMGSDTFVPALVALMYRHHTMLAAVQDLIYVECSATRKFVGSLDQGKAPEQGAPWTLIVDPNSRRLLRHNKSPFSKTERYSDEEIVATDSNENASMNIQLNRITGSFSAQTRLKKEPRAGSDTWGKCERASGEKKF
jgi:hypothetical protein